MSGRREEEEALESNPGLLSRGSSVTQLEQDELKAHVVSTSRETSPFFLPVESVR